jgi:hypothetical protein
LKDLVTLLLCSFVLAADVSTSLAAPIFRVESLGPPPGFDRASGFDVNESGDVLVQAFNAAFIWKNGTYNPLPSSNVVFSLTGSTAAGITTDGRPALWVDGVLTPLAVPSGGIMRGLAFDSNASGDAAGFWGIGVDDLPVVWHDGVPTVIGSRIGRARSINDAGVVVGGYTENLSPPAGFIYQGGTITDIPVDALAINNLGQVAGAGGMWDNGTVVATGLIGRDINDHTQITGDGQFWENGTLYDLNDLLDPATGAGWTITVSRGINNHGQIAASGTYNGGLSVPLLLTPIPEPSATLVLSVAPALLLRRRRTQVRRPHQNCAP